MEVFQHFHPSAKIPYAIHLQWILQLTTSLGVSWQTPPLSPSSRVLSSGTLLWESCFAFFLSDLGLCLQTLAELKYWLFVKYKNMSSALKSVPLKILTDCKEEKKDLKDITPSRDQSRRPPVTRQTEIMDHWLEALRKTQHFRMLLPQIHRTRISSWENIRQNRLRAIL